MSKKKRNLKEKRLIDKWFRISIQLMFFIFAPSLYSASFTAVKNSFTIIGAGLPLSLNGFVVQLILLLLFTVIFGRYFCGWACSFGAINDWIYYFSSWLQKRLKKKLPSIPEKLARILSMMKYLVLTGILTVCFLQKGGIITDVSPWTCFSLIRSRNLSFLQNKIGIILLLSLMLGMAFEERFFCRFFCPMGAIFSLLPNLPFLALKRNKSQCPEKCGACKKVCPVNIFLDNDALNMGECIRCGRCSRICPRANITSIGKIKGNE